MTGPPDNSSDDGWSAPRVEIWIDDTTDGQMLLVSGQRADAEWFIGSFFQPATDDDETLR